MQPRTDAAATNSTRSGAAYDVLRRAIVSGEIPAGEPLDEGELMQSFGFGRTPLREALKRLDSERFVYWKPRRSPIVRELSLQSLHRLYEARLELEVPVMRLAAQRITAAQTEALVDQCRLLEKTTIAGDYYGAVEADFELHNMIAAASGNDFLADAVKRLNCGSLRIWYQNYEISSKEYLAQVGESHMRLVDGLRTDAAAAEKAGQDHIANSLEHQIQRAGGRPLTGAVFPVESEITLQLKA